MTKPNDANERYESLLDRLSELPEEQRAPELEDLRASNPNLARKLETDLKALTELGRSEQCQERAPGASLGSFRLQAWLGSGSYGEVWHAYDTKLGRDVALKLLHQPWSGDEEQLSEALKEAKAAAGIESPYVVRVWDADAVRPHGPMFISMQLFGRERAGTAGCQVRTLQDLSPSPRESAQLVAKIARGMAAAHARGVVHRDLKPSNVLIGADGEPAIADFGLAYLTEGEGADLAGGPPSGEGVRGTPEFMAPEQALGQRAQPLSDVYALGATLYFLLAGRAPYLREKAPVLGTRELVKHVASPDYEPAPLSSFDRRIPVRLQRICTKAMSKSPGKRYASAIELAQELELWLQRRPTSLEGGADAITLRASLWLLRNALAAASGAFALLLVGAFVLTVVGARDRTERARALAESGRLAQVAEESARTDPGLAYALTELALRETEETKVERLPEVESTLRRVLMEWPGAALPGSGADGSCVSPSGRWLAQPSFPGVALTLWDLDRQLPGEHPRHLSINDPPDASNYFTAEGLCFTPRETHLLLRWRGYGLWRWRIGEGASPVAEQLSTGNALQVQSSDGRWAVLADSERLARLVDLESEHALEEWIPLEVSVTQDTRFAIDDAGEWLVGSSPEVGLLRWSLRGNVADSRTRLLDKPLTATHLRFSPGARWVLVQDADDGWVLVDAQPTSPAGRRIDLCDVWPTKPKEEDFLFDARDRFCSARSGRNEFPTVDLRAEPRDDTATDGQIEWRRAGEESRDSAESNAWIPELDLARAQTTPSSLDPNFLYLIDKRSLRADRHSRSFLPYLGRRVSGSFQTAPFAAPAALAGIDWLMVSPARNRAVSVGPDYTLRLWELGESWEETSSQVVASFPAGRDSAEPCAYWARDDRLLVMEPRSHWSCEVQCLDIPVGASQPTRGVVTLANSAGARYAQLSNDGRWLLANLETESTSQVAVWRFEPEAGRFVRETVPMDPPRSARFVGEYLIDIVSYSINGPTNSCNRVFHRDERAGWRPLPIPAPGSDSSEAVAQGRGLWLTTFEGEQKNWRLWWLCGSEVTEVGFPSIPLLDRGLRSKPVLAAAGDRVVVRATSGELFVCALKEGAIGAPISLFPSPSADRVQIEYSHDGRHLSVEEENLSVTVYDLPDATNTSVKNPLLGRTIYRCETDSYVIPVFDPTGRWLALSLDHGDRETAIEGGAIQISKDYDTLVWDLERQVGPYLVQRTQELETFELFGNSGRWFVTDVNLSDWLDINPTSWHADSSLWNLGPQGPIGPILLGGPGGRPAVLRNPYTFSRNDRWLLTSNDSAPAMLWELDPIEGHAKPHALQVEPEELGLVELSPSGRWVIACNTATGRWLLWDLARGDHSRGPVVLPGEYGNLVDALFTLDERYLITTDSQALRVWTLELDELRTMARSGARRNLSEHEWQRLFPDRPYAAVYDHLPSPRSE